MTMAAVHLEHLVAEYVSRNPRSQDLFTRGAARASWRQHANGSLVRSLPAVHHPSEGVFLERCRRSSTARLRLQQFLADLRTRPSRRRGRHPGAGAAGDCLQSATELEIELAEAFCQRVPS